MSLDGQDARVARLSYADDTVPIQAHSSNESMPLHTHRMVNRTPQHSLGDNERIQRPADSDVSFSTPSSKLNSSYYDAVASQDQSHFSYTNNTPEMNVTLKPGNRTLDDTLTPKLPLSPLPTNLPPPPQFGNEAVTSTPRSSTVPPSYKDAVHRSTFLSQSNSNNNNSNNNNNNNTPAQSLMHNTVTTIPGNNPGNRLSFAHHQPMIFNDEDQHHADDRQTPSPTTHTLVLDEPGNASKEDTSYNFYERQYRNAQTSQQTPTEPVKVTFV